MAQELAEDPALLRAPEAEGLLQDLVRRDLAARRLELLGTPTDQVEVLEHHSRFQVAALMAAILAQPGRTDEARGKAALIPGLRLRDVEPLLPHERTLMDRVLDGLRNAGVPK